MTHKPQVGIMQGRLSNQIGDSIQSFPGVYWKEEFDQASNLGFNTIEWIFDSHKNPLFHSDAISEIISIKKNMVLKLILFVLIILWNTNSSMNLKMKYLKILKHLKI